MTFSIRSRRSRWSIAGLSVSLLLLGSSLGLHGMNSGDSRTILAPAATPAVDPRLVLHRQTVRFAGTMAGGVSLGGTLSPSLPGLNTISLRIVFPSRGVARGGHVSLVLDMRGMTMLPVRTTLTASSADYRGYVVLPMFGRYRARVEATIAGGRYTGTVSLTLPSLTASDASARP